MYSLTSAPQRSFFQTGISNRIQTNYNGAMCFLPFEGMIVLRVATHLRQKQWAMGNGQWAMGNGQEWAIVNGQREWAMGIVNGQWAKG